MAFERAATEPYAGSRAERARRFRGDAQDMGRDAEAAVAKRRQSFHPTAPTLVVWRASGRRSRSARLPARGVNLKMNEGPPFLRAEGAGGNRDPRRCARIEKHAWRHCLRVTHAFQEPSTCPSRTRARRSREAGGFAWCRRGQFAEFFKCHRVRGPLRPLEPTGTWSA
jgi:hypothetical protein